MRTPSLAIFGPGATAGGWQEEGVNCSWPSATAARRFQQVDADRLCFSCSLVQDFARGIEEKTERAGDDAIYLACEFVELVKSRILERGRDAPKQARAGFFEDLSRGMTRVATEH